MPEEITAHRSDIDKNCDPGTKSEGEEEIQSKGKATLGRTPNHLSLSTTSTLSAGSTGSQARLIQSSHQPENYQPTTVKDLGKPTCMQCYLSGNYKTTWTSEKCEQYCEAQLFLSTEVGVSSAFGAGCVLSKL
jgi:hypothetical protein